MVWIVNLAMLSSGLNTLHSDMVNVQQQLQLERNNPQDNFVSAMQVRLLSWNDETGHHFKRYLRPFYTQGAPCVNQLKKDHEEMLRVFQDVAKYYGEDPSRTDPETFFAGIQNFIDAYNVA